MKFKQMIEEASEANRSRIVLALDLKGGGLLERALKILRDVHEHVCCIKLNKHLVLPLGVRGIVELVFQAHDYHLPVIMDCKTSDIGSTNEVEVKAYFEAGFDAVTAMPLPGWTDGLEAVFKAARGEGKGVLLVTYMSHRGASELFEITVYNPELKVFEELYKVFSRKALSWGADGVVVGATRPNIIRSVKELVDEVPIFSPGAITQGGSVEEAIKAGASYVIVGRAICESSDPKAQAERVKALAKRS